MKNFLFLAFVTLSSCAASDRYGDAKIVQRMDNDNTTYTLCGSLNGCFCTYAYRDGKIIASWFDHPNTVTDSLKAVRVEWAKEAILKSESLDTTIYIK